MRKLFATVAAVSALMAGAAYAQNVSIIDQLGAGNFAGVGQSGNFLVDANNFQFTGQYGLGNTASTVQSGANGSATLQVGVANNSMTTQWGALNGASTNQFGTGHYSNTNQVGLANGSLVIQTD